jgi:hypothetical protein
MPLVDPLRSFDGIVRKISVAGGFRPSHGAVPLGHDARLLALAELLAS